jgi:hypothetical protein
MVKRDLIASLPGEFGKSTRKGPSDSTIKFPVGTTMDAMERELILQTLGATGNNKTRAAELPALASRLFTISSQCGGDRRGQVRCVCVRAKPTLVMTGLVLLVAAVLSGVFAAQLLDQLLLSTKDRASDLANQVFVQAQRALTDAAQRGLRPSSDSPQEIHDFVRHAFEIDEGLHTQLKAAKENPLIYEVSITDQDGKVMVSTDENLPGQFLPKRIPLSQLVQRNFLHQVKVLAGPTKLFELDYPFSKGSKPFGEVRVVLNAGLLLNEISPSLWTSGTIALLAVVVSTLLPPSSAAPRRPLRDIAKQLDRISAG